jgi:glyoxylase-like metal-dependent hydrolase (beta-lactamase superfamily II)
MSPKSQLIPHGTNIATRVGVGLVMRIKSKLIKFLRFEAVDPDILANNDHSISSNCYLIRTPGHSNGSMSLIVDDEVALVGDAMFGVFWWSVFPPFADDVPTMIRSWGKLLNTGSKLFLPGHGTENSRELLEKQYNKYRAKYV